VRGVALCERATGSKTPRQWLYFTAFRIQNKQFDFLQSLHVLPIGSLTSGHRNLYQQIRQTDIFDRIEVPVGCYAKSTGDIGLTGAGRAEQDDVV